MNVDMNTVAAERNSVCEAILSRVDFEIDENAGAVTVKALMRHYSAATKLDAYALMSASSLSSFSWDVINTGRHTKGDRFNEKAITKLFEALRVLAGSSWDIPSNDGATLFCLVRILEEGTFYQKAIEDEMNKRMTALRGKRWGAGGTQTSSGLRALEALGIVFNTGKIGNGKLWGIANASLFNTLAEAGTSFVKKPRASSKKASSVVDSTCEEVAPVLAITYDPEYSSENSVADDTAEEVFDTDFDTDTLSLVDALCDAHSPTLQRAAAYVAAEPLLLTHDAAAPAKSKKPRKRAAKAV